MHEGLFGPWAPGVTWKGQRAKGPKGQKFLVRCVGGRQEVRGARASNTGFFNVKASLWHVMLENAKRRFN